MGDDPGEKQWEQAPVDRPDAAGKEAQDGAVRKASEDDRPDPQPPDKANDRSEDEVDEAVEETFPASDPPAW